MGSRDFCRAFLVTLLILGSQTSAANLLLVKLVEGEVGEGGGEGGEDGNVVEPSVETTTALAVANMKFTKKFFPRVVEEGKNLICSPFSASAALAMVYVGAGGRTEKQMKKALAIPKKKDTLDQYRELLDALKSGDKFTLEIANKLFLQKGVELKEEYVQTLEEHFHVTPKELDFKKKTEESRKKINKWIEKKTHNKIKDLLKEFDRDTLLVLVNAIYFKGTWKYKFDEKLTKKAAFHVSAAKKVDAPTMHLKGGFMYKVCTEFDAHVVELPYKGDKLSMLIVLPRKKKYDLTGMEGGFAKTTGMKKAPVRLSLPKFKVESTLDLKEPLTKIGMADMFGRGTADFSGITDGRLHISKAVQKAFVEVNEEGTEAAAATGFGFVTYSARPQDIHVNCDRPFLFGIKDKASGMLLFAGKVVDPTKKQ